MTLAELFEQCADAGIELIPDGPDLAVEGDASLLTADALGVLRSHKAAILAALNEPMDRRACLQSATAFGYPSIPIRPGETLAAGPDAWKRFTTNASIRDARIVLAELAIRELGQLDIRPSETQP
jgi:hypothetical protein